MTPEDTAKILAALRGCGETLDRIEASIGRVEALVDSTDASLADIGRNLDTILAALDGPPRSGVRRSF